MFKSLLQGHLQVGLPAHVLLYWLTLRSNNYRHGLGLRLHASVGRKNTSYEQSTKGDSHRYHESRLNVSLSTRAEKVLR